MTIDDLFKTAAQGHPIARLWKQLATPDTGSVEFAGPSSISGSAELVLEIRDKEGTVKDYKREDWDPVFHEELVAAGFKAPSLENEAERFGYALHGKFAPIEARYGDGFFSSVFLKTLERLGLDQQSEIADLLEDVQQREPYDGGDALNDCQERIEAAVAAAAGEIASLGYELAEAKRILIKALAYYLDDRFSVTARRRSGWT